jgi:hypothetical protein
MLRLRRGQAEIIGGLIVASALLLIVIPLVINLMTTSTTITTKGYTIRSQFEISRWSEKILSNNTYIVNVGSVDIEVVRVWLKNGTLVECNPWVRIPVASSIPIGALGITNISEIDSIVTSRGRVFKLEEIIPPQITIPIQYQYPPLGVSPGNIMAGSYILSKNVSIIVSCQYDSRSCLYPIAGFYYNNTWYINNGSGWVLSNVNIKSGEEVYTNLDNNYARELVVLTYSSPNYVVVNGGNLTINITFKNMTRIDSNTSLVVMYLKIIIMNTDKDSDVSSEVKVSLIDSTNTSKFISSYATFSSAKVRGAAGGKITIYEGYVMYPLTQFEVFKELGLSSGWYDINIYLTCATTVGNIYVSIEYLAIVTY